MVANATARPGLAEDVAGRLAFAGYTSPISDQALVQRGDTVIVVRSGSQLFGYQVAADLGLSADTVHLRGAGQVSRDDSRADVFVVLGKNWRG